MSSRDTNKTGIAGGSGSRGGRQQGRYSTGSISGTRVSAMAGAQPSRAGAQGTGAAAASSSIGSVGSNGSAMGMNGARPSYMTHRGGGASTSASARVGRPPIVLSARDRPPVVAASSRGGRPAAASHPSHIPHPSQPHNPGSNSSSSSSSNTASPIRQKGNGVPLVASAASVAAVLPSNGKGGSGTRPAGPAGQGVPITLKRRQSADLGGQDKPLLDGSAGAAGASTPSAAPASAAAFVPASGPSGPKLEPAGPMAPVPVSAVAASKLNAPAHEPGQAGQPTAKPTKIKRRKPKQAAVQAGEGDAAALAGSLAGSLAGPLADPLADSPAHTPAASATPSKAASPSPATAPAASTPALAAISSLSLSAAALPLASATGDAVVAIDANSSLPSPSHPLEAATAAATTAYAATRATTASPAAPASPMTTTMAASAANSASLMATGIRLEADGTHTDTDSMDYADDTAFSQGDLQGDLHGGHDTAASPRAASAANVHAKTHGMTGGPTNDAALHAHPTDIGTTQPAGNGSQLSDLPDDDTVPSASPTNNRADLAGNSPEPHLGQGLAAHGDADAARPSPSSSPSPPPPAPSSSLSSAQQSRLSTATTTAAPSPSVPKTNGSIRGAAAATAASSSASASASANPKGSAADASARTLAPGQDTGVASTVSGARTTRASSAGAPQHAQETTTMDGSTRLQGQAQGQTLQGKAAATSLDVDMADASEPLSQQPNNGADAETAQHLMRNAKLDAARARELTENSHQKLFRIKTEELVLEEKLIKSGTHPDYMEALAEIQKRMDDRTRESADRLRYAVKACESTYDSNIKFAHDTFLEAKRGLRWKMYRTATRSCFQLNAEYEQLRIMSHPVPNFTALPEVISKRKWDMMDSYENGNLRADVERSIPDWTRLVVHKRRRAGYFRLYVPPPCVGLDENEMDQDMEAIRTGTTGSADQKARPGGPKKAGKPPRN